MGSKRKSFIKFLILSALFDIVIGLCCGHLLFLGMTGKAPTAILGILILLCHAARITIQDD